MVGPLSIHEGWVVEGRFSPEKVVRELEGAHPIQKSSKLPSEEPASQEVSEAVSLGGSLCALGM